MPSPASDEQALQFTVVVDEYASLANNATDIDNHIRVAAGNGNGVEITMADNDDDVTVPLEIADIGVTKEDDVDPVLHIHDSFNYTITVTNHSEDTTATNVRVHDELPEGVGFVDFTSTGTATCDETDGVIDCTIATLAPGESVVIVVNVTGDVPGRVVNEVTVQADQKDINRDNNRDTEETLIDLSRCLPDYAIAAMREALPAFDRQIRGFAMNDALLTGVETRTSSPIRIKRGDDFQSINTRGLYPAGEGAGYAGGILSAGIDGIRIAEAVALAITQGSAPA